MNLRSIANKLTRTVNPNQSVSWLRSTGYSTDSAGKRTPSYTTTTIQAQVQGISNNELKQLQFLNIQADARKVFAYDALDGVTRIDGHGGDILQFPSRSGGPVRNWLVTTVLESWPDYSLVLVTLQQDAP